MSLSARLCSRAPLLGLLTALAWPTVAWAGGPLGDNGQAITTSNYSIDLAQTPVWAGSRVTSLGGSYVAVAYDVDGMLQNPAAPAVRPFFSVTHFDYWLGFGLTLPSSLSNMDFFNSGSKTGISNSPDSLVYVTPSAILQFGSLGVGANIEYQNYGLGDIDTGEGGVSRLSNRFTMAHIQVANAFFEGELVLGAGIRLLNNKVTLSAPGQSNVVPLEGQGLGSEVGLLWQPFGQYFRIGAAYRSAISARSSYAYGTILNENNDAIIKTSQGDYYLPQQSDLPWDFNVGVAVNVGDAKPNGPWRSDAIVAQKEVLTLELRILERHERRDLELARATTEAERASIAETAARDEKTLRHAIDRAKVEGYWKMQAEMAKTSRHVGMVTASMLVTGAVDNAVGVESFLSQSVNRSGEWAVVSPRLGAEIEVIPDFLKVRSGCYLEPTRFVTSEPRAHYTGGFDIPLGVWNVFGLWPDDYRWRLGTSIDVARDFSTMGFTVAGWYPRHRGTVKRPASTIE